MRNHLTQKGTRGTSSTHQNINGILITWNFGDDTPMRHREGVMIKDNIRYPNEKLTRFLMGEPTKALSITPR